MEEEIIITAGAEESLLNEDNILNEDKYLPSEEYTLIDEEHQRFIRDIIAIYKKQRLLWDKNHPLHKCRQERVDAFQFIIYKCKEFYPEADADFARHKLETVRSCFRKEFRKVMESRRKAKAEKDLHKPTLWYYNLMLFLVGEEPKEERTTALTRINFWEKEHIIVLISLLKNYPLLHSSTSGEGNYSKRLHAIQEITEKLSQITGKKFKSEFVRKKIQMLKGQYRKETRRLKQKPRATSTLWCFNLLDFLKENSITPSENKNKTQKQANSISDVAFEDAEGNSYICREKSKQTNKIEFTELNNEDLLDTIGKNVANKLRDMTVEQRGLAENLLNEVMYFGMMESLTACSKLVL